MKSWRELDESSRENPRWQSNHVPFLCHSRVIQNTYFFHAEKWKNTQRPIEADFFSALNRDHVMLSLAKNLMEKNDALHITILWNTTMRKILEGKQFCRE